MVFEWREHKFSLIGIKFRKLPWALKLRSDEISLQTNKSKHENVEYLQNLLIVPCPVEHAEVVEAHLLLV